MIEKSGFPMVDIYKFIVKWALEHGGNTPSMRRIASSCGYSPATAHDNVVKLIGTGLLVRKDEEVCVARGSFIIANRDPYDMTIDNA